MADDLNLAHGSSPPAPATARHLAGSGGRIGRSGRDSRVDLVRGLALCSIFVNHMPGNWLSGWTSRNFGFSDAAEGFVLMAGFAAAMAYGGLLAKGDHLAIAVKALRRAATLYAGHILTTTAAIALFIAVLRTTGRSVDLVGVAPILANPADSVLALVIGGFQLSYFNILPMYVVLLAALPLLLVLAARHLGLLVVASAGCYLLANLSGARLPAMGEYDSWYFNPIAWQAVFVAGLVVGLRARQGSAVPYRWWAWWSSAAYVAGACVYRLAAPDVDVLGDGLLPEWLGSLQKPNLAPARFVHVLALAYVVCHSRIWAWLARVPDDCLLTRMGRNSLPIFMAGSLLSMAGWLAANLSEAGLLAQAAIAAAGLVVMALLATWLETPSRPAASRVATVPVPARNLSPRHRP